MRKILIVDDDTDLLMALNAYFTRKGYGVTVTSACAEAVGLLESDMPDLVLLDINVGPDDGRETCRQIKSMAKFAAIPVILFSADHQMLRTYEDFNATAFLEKPFRLEELHSLIKRYLEK